MVDLELLKQLHAKGFSAKEIAKRLGVSRTRVYQIAERIGVRFKQNDYMIAGKPQSRVVTGGVPADISAGVAGKACELLAAADLLARGWQVFLPVYPNAGHDLVACKETATITIEVRSAWRTAAGRLSFNKKADDYSDHYALCVRGEPVSYQPELPEDIPMRIRTRRSESYK